MVEELDIDLINLHVSITGSANVSDTVAAEVSVLTYRQVSKTLPNDSETVGSEVIDLACRQ